MRSRDKLYETQFYLRQMRKFAAEYSAGDHKAFHRFRFSFNSFVSASRSITFVLQKDLKSRYSTEFDNWYEEERIALAEFAQFTKIRNVILKEGSRLPLSEICYEDSDGNIFTIVWDHAGDDIEQLIGYSIDLGPKHEIGRYFPAGATEDELKTWAAAALQEHLTTMDMACLLTRAKMLSQKLRIDDDGPAISIEEFITVCANYAEALRAIVEKAYAKFRSEQT